MMYYEKEYDSLMRKNVIMEILIILIYSLTKTQAWVKECIKIISFRLRISIIIYIL